jgi:hypothetical protein
MSSTGDPFAEYAGSGFTVPGPFGGGIDVKSLSNLSPEILAQLEKSGVNISNISGQTTTDTTTTAEEEPKELTGGELDLTENQKKLLTASPLYEGGPTPEFRFLDYTRPDYQEEMQRQKEALRARSTEIKPRTPADLDSAMKLAQQEYAGFGVDPVQSRPMFRYTPDFTKPLPEALQLAPAPEPYQVKTSLGAVEGFNKGGLATLSSQKMADKLARMGRYDDDQIAHVAEGEVIVPAPIMKYYPEVRDKVFEAIREEGFDPQEFIVGGDMVARNPRTGVQEFGFFSKVFKKIKKVVKKFAPLILAVALPYVGGPLAGTFGYSSVAQAALTGGVAGVGGGLIQGKGLKDSLKMGAKGALVSGAFSGLMGQPLTQPAPTPPLGIDQINPTALDASTAIPKVSVEPVSVGNLPTELASGTGNLATVSVTGAPAAPFDTGTIDVSSPLVSEVGAAPLDASSLQVSLPSPSTLTTGTAAGTGFGAGTGLGGSGGVGIDQIDISGLSLSGAGGAGGLEQTILNAETAAGLSGAGVQAVSTEAAKEGFLSGIRSGLESFAQNPGQFLQDAGQNYLTNLRTDTLSTLGSTAGVVGLGAGLASLSGAEEEPQLQSPFDDPLYALTDPTADMLLDPTTAAYQERLLAQQQALRNLYPLRRANEGGEIVGPGTGTSDSIPALLSDGEFVMTAKAVKGAGNGDRRLGAAKMYDMMAKLESNAR